MKSRIDDDVPEMSMYNDDDQYQWEQLVDELQWNRKGFFHSNNPWSVLIVPMKYDLLNVLGSFETQTSNIERPTLNIE